MMKADNLDRMGDAARSASSQKKDGVGGGGITRGLPKGGGSSESRARPRGVGRVWGGGIPGAFGELVGRTRAQGWCGESAGFYIGPRGEERVQSMQTFHPLASVTVAGCHLTRSKWGCETLAYPSNLRSKDTQP